MCSSGEAASANAPGTRAVMLIPNQVASPANPATMAARTTAMAPKLPSPVLARNPLPIPQSLVSFWNAAILDCSTRPLATSLREAVN